MNNAELLAKTLPEFTSRLDKVKDGQWDSSTPDDDWTVRDLVKHVVYEVLWAPPLLEGQTVEQVGDRFEGDILGDDPLAAWNRAVQSIEGALIDIDLSKTVHLSFADVPAEEYLGQLFNDVLIHSWDLAKGIGVHDTLDSQLVEADYRTVQPRSEELTGTGLFGKPVEVAESVSTQTKLLALLGRQG